MMVVGRFNETQALTAAIVSRDSYRSDIRRGSWYGITTWCCNESRRWIKHWTE